MNVDKTAGLVSMIAGALVIWSASDHVMGSFGNMGPAYFPMLVATILIVLGAINFVLPRDQTSLEPVAWRSILIVMGNFMLFSFMITAVGLFVSTVSMMLGLLAWFSGIGWKKIIAMSVGLATTAHLIFVVFLGINLGF